MPDSKSPNIPNLIAQLENDIGVPDGFLSRIIHEDDWSLVVKLHGMIEASLTQLLLAHFDDIRLEIPITKMNIGGSSGKLALVRALELLPEHNIKFIQKLSDMRNTVVHRISNVTFSIEKHVRSLDPIQLRNLIDSCGDGVMPETLDLSCSHEDHQTKTFLKDPRKLFWWSGVLVLGNLAKSKSFHSFKHKIAALEQQAGKAVLKRDQ